MRKVISALLIVTLFAATFAGCRKTTSDSSASSAKPTAIPLSEEYSDFTYEDINDDVLFTIGDTDVPSYLLNAVFYANITSLLEKKYGWSSRMSLDEKIEFGKTVLGEEELQNIMTESIYDLQKLIICEELAGTTKNSISERNLEDTETTARNNTVRYYEMLEDYSANHNTDIQTPDEAMRLMCGVNAEEYVDYTVRHYRSSWYISDFMLGTELNARDVRAYYEANPSEYDKAKVCVAFVTSEERGRELVARVKAEPDYTENIFRMYNEEKALDSGKCVFTVNKKTTNLPDEIIAWALAQNDATLSDEPEIMETDGGYYVLLCECIYTFSDDEDTHVYAEVVQDYKSELFEKFIKEKLSEDNFTIGNFSEERCYDVMSEALKVSNAIYQ